MTPFQRTKQTHYFRLVDLDRDGYISASDWAEIGRNLASLRGLRLQSAPHDAVMAFMGTIWANLSQYASDPQRERVSLDDWLRFEDERVIHCDDAWYESYVNTIVHGVFSLLDRDGDGRIGQGDYLDLMMSFWVRPHDALRAFARVDADGDGHLDRETFVALVWDFHHSDDPDTPGNWFFGPLDTTEL